MGRVEQTRCGRRSIVGAFGAAPDLDLLFHDHRGPAHSLGAAILVALAMSLLTRNLRWGLAAGLAWTSHVILDWLGNDSSPPIGHHGPLAAVAPVFPILAAPVSRGLAQLLARGVLGAQREGADRGGLPAGTAGGGCDHDAPRRRRADR